MKTLIFGLCPPEEDVPASLAITIKEEFDVENVLKDDWSDDYHRFFRNSLQPVGIVEIMDSVFEYPKISEVVVKEYLGHLGIKHDPEFERWLQSDD